MSIPRISYSGTVQPAVWLSFKADKVSGAHSVGNANVSYHVANESLTRFDLRVVTTSPNRTFTITREATRRNRRFSSRLNTYLADPVNTDLLNQIIDAHNRLTADPNALRMFLNVRIWYKPFFREMLKFMTRTASDTNSLANPGGDQAAVENSFTHTRSGSRTRITHPNHTDNVRDIPTILTGVDVTPAPRSGRPPRVKIYLYMKIKESLNAADQANATRVFMAADYSKIYRYGRHPGTRRRPWFGDGTGDTRATPNSGAAAPTGIEVCLKVWEMNVQNYLMNHVDLTRGERIRQAMVTSAQAGIARPQAQVVRGVRDDIDRRLVTANHWGDLREDWITEQYQRKLSDLFGAIHQRQWYASPVSFYREMAKALRFNVDTRTQLVLQYGTGHCGEHAVVAFSVIRQLMRNGHTAKFQHVIYTGNSNIDHAFVVGGIRPTERLRVRRQHSFRPYHAGDQATLFDLRAALAASPGVDGFVLDPYLAPSRQASTARALLTALNARRRGRKRTDHLSYSTGGLHPPPDATQRAGVSTVRGV